MKLLGFNVSKVLAYRRKVFRISSMLPETVVSVAVAATVVGAAATILVKRAQESEKGYVSTSNIQSFTLLCLKIIPVLEERSYFQEDPLAGLSIGSFQAVLSLRKKNIPFWMLILKSAPCLRDNMLCVSITFGLCFLMLEFQNEDGLERIMVSCSCRIFPYLISWNNII